MTAWIEFRVDASPETAEPIVELFNKHGRGQAVVETPVDCFEHELSECAPAALSNSLASSGWSGQLTDNSNLVCATSCSGTVCR